MKSLRWIPSDFESGSFLAIGGTDGEVEIIDLTERDKCRGFQSMAESDYSGPHEGIFTIPTKC